MAGHGPTESRRCCLISYALPRQSGRVVSEACLQLLNAEYITHLVRDGAGVALVVVLCVEGELVNGSTFLTMGVAWTCRTGLPAPTDTTRLRWQ